MVSLRILNCVITLAWCELDSLQLLQQSVGVDAQGNVQMMHAHEHTMSLDIASSKPNVNVAMLGAQTTGKSTIVGRVLAASGAVTASAISSAESAAVAAGYKSMKYAWLCDEEPEERIGRWAQRTVHTNWLPPIETETNRVTFIDVPGARDSNTEMEEGIAMADVAVLVVSAARGAFELGAGARGGSGQTVTHIQAASGVGVKRFVVAVNKMDSVEFSKDRFDEIVEELKRLLKKAGISAQSVAFVPVAGYDGVNVMTKSNKMGWYRGWKTSSDKDRTGQTLMEAIASAAQMRGQISRDTTGALRMPVKGSSAGGPLLSHIERGSISAGQTVRLCPSGDSATVDIFHLGGGTLSKAVAGDMVKVSLTTSAEITSGAVAYDESHQCVKVNSFDSNVLLDHDRHDVPCQPKDFTNNFTATVDVGFQHIQSTWKLLSAMDRRTRRWVDNPKSVGKGQYAKVRMYPLADIDLDAKADHLFLFSDKGTFKKWGDLQEWDLVHRGGLMTVNAVGDDGPPKGDMVPHNPCINAPKCWDYFTAETKGYSWVMKDHDDDGKPFTYEWYSDYINCDDI